MRRNRFVSMDWRWSFGLAALALAAPAAQAQSLPYARLFTVSPNGGKAGTTVEVTIGGPDLDECASLYFSHPGIKATQVPDPAKPGSFLPNKFSVAIEANVPLGNHDVRAISKYGMSNPRAFVVGDLNEVNEKEPNNDVPQAHKIEINETANGVISAATDVDYFSFSGKKGQRIIVRCAGEDVDSRLNPRVELFDAKSNMLIANHRYSGRDAFFAFTIPADADYYLRVSEQAHVAGHGNPEYFYRLTLSLGPWIAVAYPSVVDPAKPSQITLYGYNLPNAQADEKTGMDKLVVTVTPPNDPLARQRIAFSGKVSPWIAGLDGFEYRVKNAVGHSNPVLLTYATGPVTLDNDDNDTADKPQELAGPGDVFGWFEKKRDRDWYAFSAKANEVFVIEALAERYGSPMDLYFELYRVDAKDPKIRTLISEFDDNAETLTPFRFSTVSRDPKTRFVAPADGRYLLMIAHRDTELYAGPRYAYHLNIRREVPDFRLILADNHDFNAGGPLVRPGGSQFIDVMCFRNDGFAGEVAISVEGLPKGVTCPPQTLSGNLKQTVLVFTAAADAQPWAGEITIKGTATINGQTVMREARGGCQLWPTQPGGGVVAVSRLTRSICLGVGGTPIYTLAADIPEIAVPAGGTIPVKIKATRVVADFKLPIQLSAIANLIPQPPNGAPPPPLGNIAADKDEASVNVAVAANTAPGVYNLAIRGTAAQYPFNKEAGKPKAPINLIELAPAIKVTVYNTVADVTLSDVNPTLKIGGDTELLVKVNRTNGYKGQYKVQLVLPQGFQSVTAVEAVIPEDANEVKLVLKVPANAAPAANPGLIVRAVATVGNVTLNNDAKLGVTIVK